MKGLELSYRYYKEFGEPMLKDEFRDASSISSWAAVNVLICKMTGIMNGDSAGTFRPQATLSRAECAQTFLNLYTIGTEG